MRRGVTNWFVNIAGKNIGPTTEEEIVSQISSGQITAATMVWRDGLSEWVPLSSSKLARHLATEHGAPPRAPDVGSSGMPLVPPPTPIRSFAQSVRPGEMEASLHLFLDELSKASLAEKLMLGCQTIALVFFLIASFKCLDSDLLISRGFGIFLMGHALLTARGVIGATAGLIGRESEQHSAGISQDKRAA